MDNHGYLHDKAGAGAALQQRPLPGTPPGNKGENEQTPRPTPLQSAQPLHQPLYHALALGQQAQGQVPVTNRSRSLRAPTRRPPPPAGHAEDAVNHCTLNNSRVSLASWSPCPAASASSASARTSLASSPSASPDHYPAHAAAHAAHAAHTMSALPLSPAVLLNNQHNNALKVRRNFHAMAHAPHHPWPHPVHGVHGVHGLGAKLHPLRNALAYPMPAMDLPGVPVLQVCNNQLGQIATEDNIATKKPCRCPPEEPVHEYSSIMGPPGHPQKAALAASTEPLYWSPILKRAAGGANGGGGGGGGQGNYALPDERNLKKSWGGTSWAFKYIVQGRGRPRTGWRWLLWLLGAGAVTLIMAIGLAAYLTSGFGLLQSTEAALRGNARAGMVTLAGEFRVLSERWTPSLGDQRSAAWRALTDRIEMQLDALFEASALAALYRHSTVTSLAEAAEGADQDGVSVACELVLSDQPDLVERAGLAFLRGLKHRAGRAWLGDLAVDVQSIGFVGAPVPAGESTVPEPPSPTAADPSVPGWAPWSAWSDCYWTGSDRSGAGEGHGDMVRIRSRACALDNGRGRPLDGPEPCLLRLPSAGSHFEMEPCSQSQPGPGSPTAATILIQDTVVALGPSKPAPPPVKTSTAAVSSSTSPTPRPSPAPTSSVVPSTASLGSSSSTEPNPSPFSMTTLLVPVIATTRPTTTSTTTEAARREPRHCDECVPGEVCVALSDEPVPRCHPVKDPQDPTGCGGHCKLNFEFCQRLDVDAFRCVDDSKCLPGEWRCGNQLCIPLIKRCDGHLNCYDHTDEHDCECNLQTHFHCGNQTSCLPKSKLCDGVVDCWNAADELNCRKTVMLAGCPRQDQFTCSNGQCIPHSRFCDGFSDCGDKSDEPFGCGGDCKNHEWECGNGRCIRKRAVCNGIDDCGDLSDEKECRKTKQR